MTIIIKDELRQSVEASSEGRQTVLRTAKGQATYMNIIPAFRYEEISPLLGTGLHPAFIVNGVEKAEIMIGTYQAVIHDGEAVSLPGQDPKTGINFDAAKAACFAAGTGFHLMTNWEWAALALQMMKNGHGDLRGNTDYGKSHARPEETGTISQFGRTLTGSGPDTWRHDGTPFGIADLVGNIWEWNDGLKLVEGRILMPTDNHFDLDESKWPDTGAVIDLAEGIQISSSISERDYTGEYFRNSTVKEGYEPPVAIKRALLTPLQDLTPEGYFWVDNTEGFEALPLRGGSWYLGVGAGLAALNLYYERSDALDVLGFRPAFIE